MSERIDGIGAELLKLRGGDGKIHAPAAVEWARKHPKSRLHAALTWDDALAAEQHRVWQVRQLIAVHIVDTEGARRFVSLSIDRAEGGYRPVADVLKAPDLREVMVNDALDELRRIEAKYTRLKELDEVWAARQRVETRRQPRDQAAD